MRKLLSIIGFWLVSICAYSQDLIYSQFYNAPATLNPALNGQFEGDFRVNFVYRSQWTKIQGALSSYTLSADYQVPSFGGGFGLIINKTNEGTAYLSKTNFAGVYSYSVEFNDNTLSFGLQAGLTNRRIDFDQLVFPDQLGSGGIISGGSTSAGSPINNNKYFFDSGAGINLVANNLMVGFSTQHLNRPDDSFTGSLSRVPMRYSGYASYKVKASRLHDDDSAFIPSIVVYNQARLSSYSAGVQYKNRSVNIGLWYRGDGKQQDAVVVSLIFDIFKKKENNYSMRVGFSHDATTSKLNYTNTAGTTEAAFVFETEIPGRNRNGYSYRRTSYGNKCYDFY